MKGGSLAAFRAAAELNYDEHPDDALDVSRDGRLYVGNHVRLVRPLRRKGRTLTVGMGFRIDALNPERTQALCFHPGFDPITVWLPTDALEDWS